MVSELEVGDGMGCRVLEPPAPVVSYLATPTPTPTPHLWRLPVLHFGTQMPDVRCPKGCRGPENLFNEKNNGIDNDNNTSGRGELSASNSLVLCMPVHNSPWRW